MRKQPSPVVQHHRVLRVAHSGAHGGPQAEAHGAQAAGGQQLAGAVEVVVLGGPHLMLAHVCGDDSLSVRQLW